MSRGQVNDQCPHFPSGVVLCSLPLRAFSTVRYFRTLHFLLLAVCVEVAPIATWYVAIHQDLDNVNHGEEVLLLLLVPKVAHLCVFEQLYLYVLTHSVQCFNVFFASRDQTNDPCPILFLIFVYYPIAKLSSACT